MKKKKSKVAGLQRRKAIAGYLFIAPFILGFLLFLVKPLFQSLYMSFNTVNISASGFEYVFSKFDNYNRAFRVDPNFVRMLGEELLRMFLNTICILIFSYFVALLLNQKFKGRAFVRAIFFLPVILSSGVILNIDNSNTLMASIQDAIKENSNNNSISLVFQEILRASGIGTRAYETVFELVDQIYDVAIASGIQILIFLAGLQTIPKNMYEAASIEGSTAWESLWKITFPMTSSLFLVNMIYTIVDFCMRSDNQVIEKIRYEMISNINYGFASAMSWIYFIIVIAIIGVASLIVSKVVYYYE